MAPKGQNWSEAEQIPLLCDGNYGLNQIQLQYDHFCVKTDLH